MSEKILVVEDESSQLKALDKKLTKEGFVVISASNGEEGLQKALDEKPDLILLDVVMPQMDGVTMLKKLRETDDWGRRVSVILLTNLTETESVLQEKISQLGPYDYLVKTNWKLDDVVSKIKECLSISE